MVNILYEYCVRILDLIIPRRAHAMLVDTLDRTTIISLPKGPRIDNAPWIRALFPYKDARIKALIWELKYHENTKTLDTIGELLYDEIMALLCDAVLFDVNGRWILVPIPITTESRRARGYNQSEYIAKSILEHDTEHILLYAPQWFEKIKDTPKQSRSTHKIERMKNLVGCFQASPQVENCHVILIDDVVTTGSTLSEARSTLLSAGARDVYAFTIAH